MKVAFIGHRKIDKTEALRKRLTETIVHFITNESADTFLFGSRSEFNDLCYEVVTELRNIYPQIRRVFVRGEYEYIDRSYTDYLLTYYEETLYPKEVHGAGVLSYIKRNQVMIDICDVLIAYCDENYAPKRTRSGTKVAIGYAQRKQKRLVNVFHPLQETVGNSL